MNYRDRNGNTILNTTSQDMLLNKLYTSNFGRYTLKLLTLPSLSRLMGKLLNSKLSCLLINPFIRYSKIDMDDYKKGYFESYNQFFTRVIKTEKRPICMDKNILISPCDGKIFAYKITESSKFTIKNTIYSLKSILKDRKLAKSFEGGYCLILRLSVEDYHRYCYIDNCTKSKNRYIPGVLHTVNPIVYDFYEVYKENSREYCLMNTENFGNVVQIEVGAMLIGKIKNHHESGYYRRGQEKGMFEFGGSTIVLLFQKDKVIIDEDIIVNTQNNFETIIKLGEKIGLSN